jgi:hypothetical protein
MNHLLAQQINLIPGGTATSLNTITFAGIISGAVTLILVVAAVLFFFMLIIGGIRWIMSGGDKGATESARSQVTAALVGLVIVFAAWAIASFVGNLFGISIFALSFQNFT